MHLIDLPDWARERGGAMNHFPALDAGGTALVNIDMQTVFVAEDGLYATAHARDIIANVNALSRAMRSLGAPVIWTRQTHTAEGPFAPAAWQYDTSKPDVAAGVAALQAGARGQGLADAMEVELADVVIDKYRYGALSCPAGLLRQTLERLGTSMVVIAGVRTNCCCETTAREANMAGYKVIVASDATAAITDAEHNAALLNLRLDFADVRSTQEVLAMIHAAGAASDG
jgi:nicotinamidase-related amidase